MCRQSTLCQGCIGHDLDMWTDRQNADKVGCRHTVKVMMRQDWSEESKDSLSSMTSSQQVGKVDETATNGQGVSAGGAATTSGA
jgi:hypothetical protein